jgi:hypothetical protein
LKDILDDEGFLYSVKVLLFGWVVKHEDGVALARLVWWVGGYSFTLAITIGSLFGVR